jgi:hypothetical protein
MFFVATMIISLHLLIISTVQKGGFYYQFMFGAALGLFFTALMLSSTYGDLFPEIRLGRLKEKFLIFWAIASFFIGIVGGFLPDLSRIFSSLNVLFGIFKVIFGIRAIRSISDYRTRNIVTAIFFFIEFIAGWFFLLLPIFIELTN